MILSKNEWEEAEQGRGSAQDEVACALVFKVGRLVLFELLVQLAEPLVLSAEYEEDSGTHCQHHYGHHGHYLI